MYIILLRRPFCGEKREHPTGTRGDDQKGDGSQGDPPSFFRLMMI